MAKRIAALFDIDGTLIITGGAGAAAWRRAFDDLYGIPADIGEFTDTGMTDPDVGHRTFTAVLGREPTRAELAKVMERRIEHLYPDRGRLRRVQGPRRRRGASAPDARRGLPARAGHRQRRGRCPHKLHRARLNRFFSYGGYGSDSTDRGELTLAALRRASAVSGGSVTPDQAFVVGDTSTTWPRPMPRGSRASGWPATTSPPSSSAPPAPTT